MIAKLLAIAVFQLKKSFLFTDILKEFKFYYPHNNFSKIFNKDNDFSTKSRLFFKNINI